MLFRSLTLAYRTLGSDEPHGSSETDAAWKSGMDRWIAGYDDGGVKAIHVAEVFAKLDRRLGR